MVNQRKPLVSVIGSFPASFDVSACMQGYFQGDSGCWNGVVSSAVNQMVNCGVESVSDGQVRDIFTNVFVRGLAGCRVRERCEVINPVKLLSPITLEDVKLTKKLTPAGCEVLGLVAGPFTLLRSVVDLFYHDEKQLCFDFAHALNEELKSLAPFVDMMGIDEPFFSNEFPEYAKDLLSVVVDGISLPVRLHVCGDVSGIVPDLLDLPVDVLSHEFCARPQLFDVFSEFKSDKSMCVGALRSDSMAVEPVDSVCSHLCHAIEVFGDRIVQVSPDCGLRMLSVDVATDKLRNLVAAREVVFGAK